MPLLYFSWDLPSVVTETVYMSLKCYPVAVQWFCKCIGVDNTLVTWHCGTYVHGFKKHLTHFFSHVISDFRGSKTMKWRSTLALSLLVCLPCIENSPNKKGISVIWKVFQVIQVQEVWSVNARLYIAAISHIFDLISFSLIKVPNTLPLQYIPRPCLFISTGSLPPIQKPYIAYINFH